MKIIVKAGLGKPVNPHEHHNIDWSQKWDNGETESYENSNDRHERFNKNSPELICVHEDMSVVKDGEYDNYELVWRMYDDNDGYEEWSFTDTPDRDRNAGYKTRQVYKIKSSVPAMVSETYPGWEYQPLFDLMSEHGLTLLQGEMDEIIDCVKSLNLAESRKP